MQICIHRGAKEIGGSCVEVISAGKRLIIDLGLPLDADKNDKKYLPNISGFDGNDDSLLAILISHPHLDHFGLLAHISPKIPVIMGIDARRILTKAAPFLPGNWPVPAHRLNLKSEIPIEVKEILDSCIIPRPIQNIMELAKWKDRTKFRANSSIH